MECYCVGATQGAKVVYFSVPPCDRSRLRSHSPKGFWGELGVFWVSHCFSPIVDRVGNTFISALQGSKVEDLLMLPNDAMQGLDASERIYFSIFRKSDDQPVAADPRSCRAQTRWSRQSAKVGANTFFPFDRVSNVAIGVE